MNGEQPPANGLRAAVAPWFDQPAAWFVWLCVLLATLGPPLAAALPFSAPGDAVAIAALAAAAAIAAAGRTAGLAEVDRARRIGWRLFALALAAHATGMAAGGVAALLPIQYVFAPAALAACAAFMASTRGQPFDSRFWLEAAAVGLCTGGVLWVTLPFAGFAALDAAVVMLAAVLLLRRSDWQGWPGLTAFACAAIVMAAARLAEAAGSPGAERLQLAAIAAFAIAAQLEYLRAKRRVPPMDAADRGSPLASLLPYAALLLAGSVLLARGGAGGLRNPVAWVLCVSVALLLARQALATGVTADAQAGLARRSAEARFAALIRNTADVIAIVDARGAFSYLTPTAERIFGQPAQALIGRKLAELVAFDDRARLRDFFARDLAQAGASAHIEARVPRGDEKHRIVEIHGSNMEHERAISGFLLNLRDNTDRKGMEEQLKRLALHDPLTLLGSRSLFRDRLEHALAVSKRNGRGVAVLFVDLDNFKRINDSFGHATGDRVLHRSAQRLVKATRNGDTVARFGGDEFAVLLENLTGRDQVVEIAARVVEALQGPMDMTGQDMRIGASVGVAFAEPEDGVEELLRNADVAMYASKARGKGCYTVYQAAMNRAASERQELEAEIARAMQERQFLLHYLPTVELQSGYLLGVEALIRWQHPKRGLIGPVDFLPVADQSGQIVTLGRWVMAQACREVKVWQARLPEGRQVRVSVNVSAVQLAQSHLCADVENALRISSLDPGNLVVELKESVLMQNTEEVLATLMNLRQLGVRIAIDDFGTGLSSLSYLHRFPIDILKIDRSFVEQLGRLDEGAGLARAIIALGETLGLEVVAEGIESERQQQELIALGCVAGQGYYYSKPGLLHELEHSIHMLRRRTMADTLPQGARFTATGRFVVGDFRPTDLAFDATATYDHELKQNSK
ncbi:MAG: putative bifunctional diguanylate cyclase/phosphodiesterase [Gammaproteobacteria bacterium]